MIFSGVAGVIVAIKIHSTPMRKVKLKDFNKKLIADQLVKMPPPGQPLEAFFFAVVLSKSCKARVALERSGGRRRSSGEAIPLPLLPRDNRAGP